MQRQHCLAACKGPRHRTKASIRTQQPCISLLHHPSTRTNANRKTRYFIILISDTHKQQCTTNSAPQRLPHLKPTEKPKPQQTNRPCCHTAANHALAHDHAAVRRASRQQNKQLRMQQSNPTSASTLTTNRKSTSNTSRTKWHALALLWHA